jgi:hypothetical protein
MNDSPRLRHDSLVLKRSSLLPEVSSECALSEKGVFSKQKRQVLNRRLGRTAGRCLSTASQVVLRRRQCRPAVCIPLLLLLLLSFASHWCSFTWTKGGFEIFKLEHAFPPSGCLSSTRSS